MKTIWYVVLAITVISGIYCTYWFVKGFFNPVEYPDSYEDEILRKQINQCGRKTFGKQTEEHSPENLDLPKAEKRMEFKNYCDEDVNQDFLSGLIN